MPKISIVIPSYNHADFIGQAIQSVLEQTESDLELIIVDDGSSDESVEVIKEYHDERITLIKQDNQGAHAAINRGIRESRGSCVSILNSDDVYHLDRLEKLVKKMEENPNIGLIGSYIEVIDQAGKPLGVKHGYHNLEPWLLEKPERSFRAGDNLHAVLMTENYFATSSNFLFHRKWFDRIGEFLPLRFAHDWDFALKNASLAEISLYPEALLQYRVHPKNTIRMDKVTMIFEICWILAVHLPVFLQKERRFSDLAFDKRIDQLLHSIYTYDYDRVLNLLLMQNISSDKKSALQLLEVGNPVRNRYLEYIQSRLNTENEQEEAPISRKGPSGIETVLVRIKKLRLKL